MVLRDAAPHSGKWRIVRIPCWKCNKPLWWLFTGRGGSILIYTYLCERWTKKIQNISPPWIKHFCPSVLPAWFKGILESMLSQLCWHHFSSLSFIVLDAVSEKLKAHHTQRTSQSKTLNQPGLWTPFSSLSPVPRPFTILHFSTCFIVFILQSGSFVVLQKRGQCFRMRSAKIIIHGNISSLRGVIWSCRQAASLKSGSWHLFSKNVSRKFGACPKEQAHFWVVGLFGISLHQEYIQHHISMMCSRLHNNI